MIELEEIHTIPKCYRCGKSSMVGIKLVLHEHLIYIPIDWHLVFAGSDIRCGKIYELVCPKCLRKKDKRFTFIDDDFVFANDKG